MTYSFGYYLRELKGKYSDFKNFFKNIVKFRKFLKSFREWDGYYLEEFFSDYLYVMYKFYSNQENVMQVEESRLQILDQIIKAQDLLQPAFDETYRLEDKEIGTLTKEDFEESYKQHGLDRDLFFLHIAKHFPEWWD